MLKVPAGESELKSPRIASTDDPSFRAPFLLALFFGASSGLSLPKLLHFLRFHNPSFFSSTNCLTPISDLWPCDLPRHVAVEPTDFLVGAITLLLLVLPWEIARQFALASRKNRLFWFLTTIVGFFVLLFFAAWFEPFWEDRRMLLFGALGKRALQPRIIDFLRLWHFEWGIAWGQLIPAALIAGASPCKASSVLSEKSGLRPISLCSLFWIAIVAGVTYELVSEIVVSLMGFSKQPILFQVPKALGGFGALVVAGKHAWLIRATPPLGTSKRAVKPEKKLVPFLRAYQVGLWLILFLSLSLLALQAIVPPDLDVTPNPSGRTEFACPFLSTAEVIAAGYILLIGILFGEVIKITAAAVPQGDRLWRVGVYCQIRVAIPAALALSWNWLQAGVVFLFLGSRLCNLVPALGEELLTLRGGRAPWLLAALAVLGARSCSSLLGGHVRELEGRANERPRVSG